MRNNKILLTYLGVVAIVVAFGWFLFNSSNVDPATLPGEAVSVLNQEHIAQGSFDHPEYNSNPPTSGWHWPQPAEWGIYEQSPADEQLVHNLEHGGIWISYQPGADEQVVEQLRDFARRYRKVIVAPREANDSAIALAAWGRLQKLETYNEESIIEFIEAFYDKGPEKVD